MAGVAPGISAAGPPRQGKLLGVSPGTLYNHIPDLRELRNGVGPKQVDTGAS